MALNTIQQSVRIFLQKVVQYPAIMILILTDSRQPPLSICTDMLPMEGYMPNCKKIMTENIDVNQM